MIESAYLLKFHVNLVDNEFMNSQNDTNNDMQTK